MIESKLPDDAYFTKNQPTISVVMASYKSEKYIRSAILSVLGQSISDLELIICDDASPDNTVSIVQEFVDTDQRVRLITSDKNGGPAVARNRGLKAARGTWIAVVDSDDLLHPQRFERLLIASDAFQADIVADDLLHFDDAGVEKPAYLLHGGSFMKPFQLTTELMVGAEGGSGNPLFGYLKPIIKREKLNSIGYDEALTIGEDYDFMLRMIVAGLRFFVTPDPTYLYRRHGASISHRLNERALTAIIENQERFQTNYGPFDPHIEKSLAVRLQLLRQALSYQRLVSSIKRFKALTAISLLIRQPLLLSSLWTSLYENLSRRFANGRNDKNVLGAEAVLLAENPHDVATLEKVEAMRISHSTAVSVEQIPPYKEPHELSWSGEAERKIWLRLASLAGLPASSISSDGKAGKYAMGFIPNSQLVYGVPNPAQGIETP